MAEIMDARWVLNRIPISSLSWCNQWCNQIKQPTLRFQIIFPSLGYKWYVPTRGFHLIPDTEHERQFLSWFSSGHSDWQIESRASCSNFLFPQSNWICQLHTLSKTWKEKMWKFGTYGRLYYIIYNLWTLVRDHFNKSASWLKLLLQQRCHFIEGFTSTKVSLNQRCYFNKGVT